MPAIEVGDGTVSLDTIGDPVEAAPVGSATRVELNFGEGWVDVSGDVVSAVKASWGIHGNTPKDRVADAGTMTFDLDNGRTNVAGLVGFYAPGSVNARAGFNVGAGARLVLHNALLGDKVRWQGTIADIVPVAGISDPRTAVSCVDWMDEAARAKLSLIAVQTNIQADALFTLLLAAVDRQPPNGSRSGTGSDIYPYALDNTQDESSRVLGEIQKLAMSEYGLAYCDAGVAVFEGRRRRGGEGTIRYALDEDTNLTGLGVTHSRDDIINRAQISIHPRRVDAAATTILFNLGSAIQIFRGTSATFDCPYRDPNQQAQRVGGKDMVPPVASTDYKMFANEDGSGADLTAQVSVSATFGGNSAQVTVSNAGPQDGYLMLFQLRGRGLYDFEPVIFDQIDASSQALYGENVFGYDMPYQSDPNNAVDLATFILSLNSASIVRVATASFLMNWDDEAAEQAFNITISDRVTVTAPSVGLASVPFFVNGLTIEVQLNGVAVVTLDLCPVDTSQFWVLDVPGRTELDETTILGYGLFVPGWILDTSTLGTDSFLN